MDSRLRACPSHIAIIVLVVALHIVTFHVVSMHLDEYFFDSDGRTKYEGAVYDDGQQYAYYADSIIDGTLWLKLDVPEWLAEMDNPYDANKRFELAYETGEPFYWDFAFYEGHYYCYFGALPALVAFVPYKLLTGADLRTDYAVSFFAAILAIVLAVFLYRFMRRYFPRVTLGIYVLAFMLFAMGCGILTQVFYPLFYSLPPLAGLACLFMGLTFWVCARRPDGSLSKMRLSFGSLFMALTLACRPQLFLAMFLSIPLFWDEIVQERKFFSRKGAGNTVAIIVPCALVVGCIMFYNFARFDSPFDFGASYNLTGFDMTQKQGFSITTALVSLLFYIFMPIQPTAEFPFMDEIEWRYNVPVEPYLGGFFAFAPACIAILGIWHFRRALKEKRLFGICCTGCVMALVLMVISAQVASISMRYFSDFCWAILIPALCVWLVWMEKHAGTKRYTAIVVLFAVAVILGEVLCYWSLLSPARYGALEYYNPHFWSILIQMFPF